jgi:uncharacterized protein (DUF1800 family)
MGKTSSWGRRSGWLLGLVVAVAGCTQGDTADDAAAPASAKSALAIGAPSLKALPSPTQSEAARFLTQTTFGPTEAEINQLTQSDYDAWLTAQFAKPIASHYSNVLQMQANGVDIDDFSNRYAIESFWKQAVTGQDQLRQRVAWALSQIFVVGDQDNVRNSAYYDVLAKDAFGNYRQLLEDVTLSPAMGQWLSHIGNQKEDAATGRLPDENYAREVMQLFSIGLWQLNPDGTRKLDGNGQPIPTYGPEDIRGMAKVLTGWSYANCDPVREFWYCFKSSRSGYYRQYADVTLPMQPYDAYHSTVAKTIVTGRVLPAGRTARADLTDALDTLYNHPNVGPFIGRQLIQRLVKSNPSPAYVARVSAVFDNNGAGVRGDLKAVIRAILLDAEARDLAQAQTTTAGKLREPVVMLAQYFRLFATPPADGRWDVNPWWMNESFAQRPMSSASVFNFYRPDYQPPGEMGSAGLAGPEFQILHEATVVDSYNFIEYWATGDRGSILRNHTPYSSLSANPAAMVDKMSLVLTSNTLSPEARTTIINAVTATSNSGANGPENRFIMALMLFEISPDYKVQK